MLKIHYCSNDAENEFFELNVDFHHSSISGKHALKIISSKFLVFKFLVPNFLLLLSLPLFENDRNADLKLTTITI